MNHVRETIGHQLLDILHHCHNADVIDEGPNYNDLNHRASIDTVEYVELALISLGFNQAVEGYRDGGVYYAHNVIAEQYGKLWNGQPEFEHVEMQGGAA